LPGRLAGHFGGTPVGSRFADSSYFRSFFADNLLYLQQFIDLKMTAPGHYRKASRHSWGRRQKNVTEP
jgi:hypothetical protein